MNKAAIEIRVVANGFMVANARFYNEVATTERPFVFPNFGTLVAWLADNLERPDNAQQQTKG